jgi:uncharacterized membrane protein SpoIIM required for sporulation
MRETQFIKQNEAKWAKFERSLGKTNVNPDELSDLFVEITDDLSYSRTFYPNRSVRVYLNNIAQKVFYSVYKNRKNRLPNFLDFWRETVPQVIYESRKAFLLSFLIFWGAALIGAFSSYMDVDFPRVILGDEYIDMTYENIANGNPMGVYQKAEETDMFLQIAFNNLMVATKTFILGIFFCIGSIFILIQNGIMLGSFQYLFIGEGIYMESFFTIWLHGTIEISCIIIAGAAGITMGAGLVFPGTLSRIQSLQLSARRGLLIMLTVLPLIVLAAFIEGFITRYSGSSYIARGIVIFGSLAFIISYYVVYPVMKARKGFTSFLQDVKLPHAEEAAIKYDQIKTAAYIFSDAFILYRKHLKVAGVIAGVLSLVYMSALITVGVGYEFKIVDDIQSMFLEPAILVERTGANVWQLLFHDSFSIGWLLNLGATVVMSYLVCFWVQKDVNKDKPISYNAAFWAKTFTTTIACSILIQLCLMTEDGWLFLIGTFIIPIVLLIQVASFNENLNFFSAMGRAFSLIGGNWTTMMGTYLAIMGMSFIFLFMATAPIAVFYLGIIVNAFPIADVAVFRQGFYILLYAYLLTFLFPLVYIGFGIGFFSFRETKEAGSIFAQIEKVGVRKISYGMEREV